MSDPAHEPVGLPDAVHSVGELAGELAHALRNPVSALATSVELLTGGRADPDDVPQLHRVMKNELAKLTELLSRCRELMRLTTLELAPTDLARIVRTRVEARVGDLAARSIGLHIELLADGAAPLRADEIQLGSSIDGLLSNAIDAMAAGGELTVALVREGERATLTIRDTGAGIAATTLPNVFRLFFTTKKGAQGMGLPVARQVMLAHGGTIAIASTPGQGTTVTVVVPVGRLLPA